MKQQVQLFLKTLFLSGLVLYCLPTFGQENRTFDGSDNNLQNPQWGAVGTNQLQVATNGFSDEVSEPAGLDRPNARLISNTVFNQDGLLPDVMELSDYAWVWGQFIDHDITLVDENPDESIEIAVPTGDPFFDPNNSGTAVIGMHRSAFDPNSGTDASNPRAFPNSISSFVDASGVYGSDETKANWLRTYEGGKLKTSSGNLLPYNTTTGEWDAPIDTNAPEMAMPFPFVTKFFIAGDVRANENPLLTSIHTLFVREHNRRCEDLVIENPTWTDEEIYQKARKMVGGLVQAIVYEEWLPTLGVHLENYDNYNPDLEVGIMNTFSAAAYRYGHTVINSTLIRMDNNGDIVPQGNVLLRNAYFNPSALTDVNGISPYLKGMATQVEQDFDCKMIHDLRNFLFGAPGAGGLDLAAMNITRGRERGLPDYNTARVDFGLPAVESFSTLSPNPWLNQILEGVYGEIDKVDAWVGFLAEDHMPDALFGESVMKIMELQFTILRDGDRFYYEIDGGLTAEEISEIKGTRFSDVVLRNSSATDLQEDIFIATSHTTTSLAQVEKPTIEFEVYPNPTSNNLYINMGSSNYGNGVLQISNMLGHVIQKKGLNVAEGMNTFEFNLGEDLPQGFYVVTLQMDNKVGHQQVYKK